MTDCGPESQPKLITKFVKDYDFEGKAGELLITMQSIVAAHGSEATVYIGDDSGGLDVFVTHMETDEEVKARLALKERNRNYRYQQYMMYKQEFESGLDKPTEV